MKNRRQNDAGSLNTKMPTMTVPTAPIPVHTGYAVPKGMVLVAFVSSTILSRHSSAKATYHIAALFPVSTLPFPRQNANPVSHIPATINNSQSISIPLFLLCKYTTISRLTNLSLRSAGTSTMSEILVAAKCLISNEINNRYSLN